MPAIPNVALLGLVAAAYLFSQHQGAPSAQTPPSAPAPPAPPPPPAAPGPPAPAPGPDLAPLLEQIAALQTLLDQVRQQNQDLVSQIAQVNKTIQEQQQALNALDQDLAQLRQKAQGLQQTADILQQQLAQAQAQLAAVQQDNQTLASLQLPQAQATVAHQQEMIQQLEQTIQVLQAQVAQLQKQIADLQALLQASQQNLEDARKANAALAQQIAQMQQTIQNQAQAIQQLTAETAKLRDLLQRLAVVVDYYRFRRETEALNQTVQNQVAASGIEARWHRVSAEVIQGTMVEDWVKKIQALLPKPQSRGAVAWPTRPETVMVNCTGVNMQVRLFALPYDQTVNFRWSASGANTGFLGLIWSAGGIRAFDQGRELLNDWQLGHHPQPETGQKSLKLPSGVYALLAYTSGGGNGQAQIQADFQIYDTKMPEIPAPPKT